MTPEQWQAVKGLFSAALERPQQERAAFLDRACAGDPEQRRLVEELLASADGTWSLLDGPPAAMLGSGPAPDAADTRVGQHIGPYEVVSEIGHGGMGTVYLARRADGQFHQTVALKLVRRGMDTDAVLARFRNEREILARLHHPNIAQLYDGGATEDGLPFFAMEHVEGEPLLDYCDRRRLSTAERLRLFREVCFAVHYAHQNLVVHRDIKPSNILMTPGGAPKLLDFGIAKVLDSSSGDAVDRTATALRAMTPDYASPEQVRGEPVTTATDVYSLGVVLYELLSGRRPYRVKTGDPEELARLVCQEEPERPSAVVPELRGDLDNIVSMAMRKEPERRYASAEQLSEDIWRHLQGQPVIARHDTLGYRAGKFVRRNRAAVSAAVLVVLTLAVALALTLAEARRARAAEARAERRFAEVRKVANTHLFELHDAIKSLPGSTPARALLVRRALEYLDGLAKERGTDASLRREVAEAYQRVGDVQAGITEAGNLGDTAGALRSYRKALAIREALAANEPRNAALQKDLSVTCSSTGRLLARMGDFQGSLANYEKALRLRQALVAANPVDPKLRNAIAVSYHDIGSSFVDRGDYVHALEFHRKEMAIFDELLKLEPRNGDRLYNAALASKRVGALLQMLEDQAAAAELYRKAILLDQERSAANPLDTQARLDLSYSYGSLGGCLRRSGDLTGALENYGQALAIREALAAADPKNARLRDALASAHRGMGDLKVSARHLAGGLQAYHKALEIFETLSNADPANVDVRGEVAATMSVIGDAHAAAAAGLQLASRRRASWAEARSWYRRSLDVWLGLEREGRLPGQFTGAASELRPRIAGCDAALAKLR